MGEVPLRGEERSPRTFRLRVEYDGSGFKGWQVQPGARTVQGELERVLERVLVEVVRVSGSGRTDRGVHALGQVASFRTSTSRSAEEIRGALSAWLPPDIVVRDVAEVPQGFHARHSAVRRHYRYVLGLEKTALDRERCWVVPCALRIGRMRRAAAMLVGEHDFSEFTVARSEQENRRATIHRAAWRRRGAVLEFDIEGNRFLRRMVRVIVGALVEVGLERMDPSALARALDPGEKLPRFRAAPPQGLYLVSVTYEDGRDDDSGFRTSRT